MPDVSLTNLMVVCAVAALAPLLLGFLPRLRLPAVVLEIVLGMVLGPSILGWIRIDLPVQILSLIGLAFLLFLSGLEIEPSRLRGTTLRLAVVGYVVSLVAGAPIALGLGSVGWVTSPLLVLIALSATSLGLVVPVLKDAGQVDTPVGQQTVVAATTADLAAILLLSVFFSTGDSTSGSRVVLLASFGALVASTGFVIAKANRSVRVGEVVLRLQDTTAEIRVRFAVVLLVAFTALAEAFGLESILGAFLAGVVVTVLDKDADSHPHFRTKLEAIGFGFVIPIFFISSGALIDVQALIDSPSALVRVPLFLAALLVIRGTPALLHRRQLGNRSTAAMALLQATSLPFIVAVAQIGTELGLIHAVTGAAMIVAGVISVLVFPAVSLWLLTSGSAGEEQGTAGAPTTSRSPGS